MNICLVSANAVMEHFAFPGNIDFAADDQGAFCCVDLSSVKHSVNNVYHRWITKNSPRKWHTRVTSGSKSSPRKILHRNSSGARTLTSNTARTTKEKTSTRNRGAERTLFSTAKATPTTRDRGTRDWRSEALWSFYTVQNPNLLVCRFPRRYIDQSLQSFSSVLRPEE